ncbi:MAG: hypothetical protein IH843_06780 [Thaumarchaeota archaeon]|nr:hypothetical protein [Nitrososphaerota archaeon]
MNKYIKTDESLPKTKKVDSDYSESKLVVCLTNGKHEHIAKLNTGIEDGEKWDCWYSPADENTLENVTHWCDCIPELPID